MCLVTKQKRAKIAKEDMVVYKYLITITMYDMDEKIYHSPYNNMKWVPGKLEKTKIKKATDMADKEFFDAKAIDNYNPTEEVITFYKEGFHFALIPERLSEFGRERIYKFIIPKGAKYYLDETGLGVTNQIMMAPLN